MQNSGSTIAQSRRGADEPHNRCCRQSEVEELGMLALRNQEML
jgi:hypothetical protein